MIYLDRKLNTIDKPTWQRLFADREYCFVASHAKGDLCVEAHWVGICASSEKPPKPFLVQCKMLHKGQWVDDGPPEWCATEGEALGLVGIVPTAEGVAKVKRRGK